MENYALSLAERDSLINESKRRIIQLLHNIKGLDDASSQANGGVENTDFCHSGIMAQLNNIGIDHQQYLTYAQEYHMVLLDLIISKEKHDRSTQRELYCEELQREITSIRTQRELYCEELQREITSIRIQLELYCEELQREITAALVVEGSGENANALADQLQAAEAALEKAQKTNDTTIQPSSR